MKKVESEKSLSEMSYDELFHKLKEACEMYDMSYHEIMPTLTEQVRERVQAIFNEFARTKFIEIKKK